MYAQSSMPPPATPIFDSTVFNEPLFGRRLRLCLNGLKVPECVGLGAFFMRLCIPTLASRLTRRRCASKVMNAASDPAVAFCTKPLPRGPLQHLPAMVQHPPQ